MRILPVLLVSTLISAGCQKSNDIPQAAEVPELPQIASSSEMTASTRQAPAFVLPALSGDSLDSSDYEGKTLLVNFWATWCGPCIAEIPDLIALQDELGSEDFSVIGISMDITDAATIQEFVEAMEIDYPIAIDEGPVAEAFGGVYSLPTTFVVDKEGIIRQRTIGIFPVEEFKPHLISLIEEE